MSQPASNGGGSGRRYLSSSELMVPLGSVCCSKILNNSVEASEDGLELGSKGRLGSTVLVKPLHESSKGLGGHVGIRWLFSNSIVRSVQLVLVGDSPDLLEVSVDG